MFTMRTSLPEKGNKFYNTKSQGGYSYCIVGKPTCDGLNVLANCVGYACGRFNEIIGKMDYPYLNCNAEDFIVRGKALGLKVSDKPTLGGIMVWEGKGSLAGHVAVVEKIIDENTIYTSESGYESAYFWNSTRKNNNKNWGAGVSYKYIGCLINPSVNELKPLDEIAKDVIDGKYGNYPERKTLLEKEGYNYREVQDKVNEILNSSNENLLNLVKQTIRGDFGNGEERKQKLGKLYDVVQRQVNLNYQNGTTSWNSVRLY